MISRAFFVFSLLALPLVLSAPTALDANTLLQNGQAAQQLNAQFQTLKVTDSCNNGDTACISKLATQCTNGVWQTQQCSGGNRQCFALPSVTGNGTFIACTSEANALSLIAATGAQGGLTSNSTSSGITSVPSDNNSSSSSSTSSGTTGAVTVTQTIILPSAFPAETLTIPTAEASSLISSLLNGGGSPSLNPTPTPTSTSSASMTSSTSNGTPVATSVPPSIASTIKLNRSLASVLPVA